MWKRVAELERGDKYEGAAQGKEEVARCEGVAVNLRGEGKENGSDEEQDTADDSTDSRAVAVEDGSNWKCCNVGRYGRHSEHEVQPDFLLKAWKGSFFNLFLRAQFLEDALVNENGFDGSISEHHSGSEQAVDNGEDDLDLRSSQWIRNEDLRGNSLPVRLDLETSSNSRSGVKLGLRSSFGGVHSLTGLKLILLC